MSTFEEGIRIIAKRAEGSADRILTEEATKNALIMPFLQNLGYDVFDPEIVIPEFTADHGIKKGEKVDYAVKVGGEVRILIECKPIGVALENVGASQLYRYFSVTNARLALLTNGLEYRFFSDLDQSNRMDAHPFFIFSLSDNSPSDFVELRKFRFEHFALESILASANDLKYMSQIKAVLGQELSKPSDELIEMVARRVYQGRLTSAVREWLSGLVLRALRETLRERLNQRLSEAIERPDETTMPRAVEPDANLSGDDAEIETTDEEIEAFQIIRAICRKTIPVSRLVLRDAKSYCAILLDDNNRKAVSRLYFNRRVKRIGIFIGKEESKFEISSLDDIYNFGDHFEQSLEALGVTKEAFD